ncbi:hypothetical protein HNR35_000875 [Borreliella spielmanii]|uniref:Decorin binding protein A n=1 Tax=Borreliella spielmanii TaxID=88916 RepID=A0ABR6P997_9SPIR|nr:decorin-binding protein DbpA [Borreliella spielmanii]MBB6031872.1 hypothetical protein [Borreliella spielmanii]
MNKCTKNLLKLSLLASLLVACGLTGETKIRLESSAKEIKDEINKLKQEAIGEGVNFSAFTDKATGSGVAGSQFIFKAKIRATDAALKFVTAIKEEAEKLKESGSSGAFSAMYDLMLDVSEPLEKIGVGEMTKTVSAGIVENPPTTAERVIEIANKMEEKLKNVNKKNVAALEKKETAASSPSTPAKK